MLRTSFGLERYALFLIVILNFLFLLNHLVVGEKLNEEGGILCSPLRLSPRALLLILLFKISGLLVPSPILSSAI